MLEIYNRGNARRMKGIDVMCKILGVNAMERRYGEDARGKCDGKKVWGRFRGKMLGVNAMERRYGEDVRGKCNGKKVWGRC